MFKSAMGYILIGLMPIGIYLLQISGFDYIHIEPIQEIIILPTYLCFALIGFLGWRLNQSRISLIVLLLILFYFSSLHTEFLGPTGIGKIRLRQILSVSFPLTLMFIFLTKEARMLSKQSTRRVVLALSPIMLMTAWFIFEPVSFHKIASWRLIPLEGGFKIPQLSIVAIFALVFVLIRNKDKKIRPFMIALLISLIPFFTMIHIGLTYGTKHSLTTYTIISFSAICIILLHSILKMYWQRVYMDELTDIPNRRALDESLATIKGLYCLAMIDIDHFKKFNDTYGHDEGDNVLRFVASILEKIRGGKVYRYGGEEFCAVFKNTSIKDAFRDSDEIRRKMAEKNFYIRSKKARKMAPKGKKRTFEPRKAVQVTISIGIASPDRKNPTPDKVFKLADNALYKAKSAGRNRVGVAD